MLDYFNKEIPSLGPPKLPDDYWMKKTTEDDENLQEINTNFALKDLSEVSIFNPKK